MAAVMDRKRFLRLSAATAVAASQPAVGRAQPTARKPARTLIRGADLLTMDDRLGEITRGDVLIEGGRIAAVGKGLKAADAEVIEAADHILMPGMIDGHRHGWETISAGLVVKTSNEYPRYYQENNQKLGVVFRPEDCYLGAYVGGLAAIDTGVTAMLDHAHATQTPEKGEALIRGALDSGIGGVLCYALSHTPTYGAGATIAARQAAAEFGAPADEWHFRHAEAMRAKYFTGGGDLLRFGVALSGAKVETAPQVVAAEFKRARTLGPALMTQHSNTISRLQALGLLGPDYHQSHATQITAEELKMMAGSGAKLCATPIVEYTYPEPSMHARAHAAGVDVGIGVDVPLEFNNDFFEQVRAGFYVLQRDPRDVALSSAYTARDVLAFATSRGARALGLGDITGSITVGKRADLLLLKTGRIDFPMRGTLAERVVGFAHQRDIDSVWVAGKARKRGGAMLGVDWARLKADVVRSQAYTLKQAATIRFT